MAFASYIQVLLCLTAATQMAYCNDIYFSDNEYFYVSEDVGSIFINISSRAVEDKEAFFDFYYTTVPLVELHAIPGVDFEFENISNVTRFFNFTIPAGSTRSFEITIIDDSIAEYFIKIIFYDIGVYDSGGRDYCDSGRIILEDNDGLHFELLHTGVTVDEDVGSVELCVTYKGDNVPSAIDATILQTYDGDLLFNATDFTLSNGGRICFDVIVVDDDEIEYQESFGFDVHFQNGHFYDLTRIYITDNEAFRFGFERSSYSVLESEGVVTVCVTADRGDGSEVFILSLYSVNVTTQEGVDHGSLTQQNLTVSANHNRQCVNITVVNDTIAEDNEFLQISLAYSHISGFNPFQTLITSTTVTITDDDLTCSPVCVNGVCIYPGVCLCDEGWIDEDCSRDIDECLELSDKCSRTEPVAECINLEGSYKCSCDHHTGYRLNGTACEDVNECEEGRHICTGLCVNTAGSHHCSCSEGFVLDTQDRRTCHDIDECNSMNSGCQHSCTNTFGSFYCSCDTGYELLDDGLMCDALSCDPPLEAPENGSIVCDKQTVGGTCSFQCDEGYTLRGSPYRTCSPSLQWSGRPAICDPPTCPELDPPDNGFVLFPCTREEGDTCSVVCAHGFTTNDPTNQICEKDDSTDSLMWSMRPHCEESNPCSPNPCMNGGVCLEDGNDFSCACNGTGYGGPTCQTAIIFFDYIPPPTMGTEFQVRVFTKAVLNSTKTVQVTVQRSGSRKLFLSLHLLEAEYTADGEVGVITVSMPSNSEDFMYEPQQRTVFISGGSQSDRPSYFDQLNLPRGQLKPGCCTPDTDLITCPASAQTISFQSSCQWVPTLQPGGRRSPGIVFAEGNNISLPTSISGVRYRHFRNRYFYNLLSSELLCMPCDECVNDNAGQYNFTLSDLPDLLSARALGFTYIQGVQQLLPSWLNMFVDLKLSVETSPLTRYDSFAPTTPPMKLQMLKAVVNL